VIQVSIAANLEQPGAEGIFRLVAAAVLQDAKERLLHQSSLAARFPVRCRK